MAKDKAYLDALKNRINEKIQKELDKNKKNNSNSNSQCIKSDMKQKAEIEKNKQHKMKNVDSFELLKNKDKDRKRKKKEEQLKVTTDKMRDMSLKSIKLDKVTKEAEEEIKRIKEMTQRMMMKSETNDNDFNEIFQNISILEKEKNTSHKVVFDKDAEVHWTEEDINKWPQQESSVGLSSALSMLKVAALGKNELANSLKGTISSVQKSVQKSKETSARNISGMKEITSLESVQLIQKDGVMNKKNEILFGTSEQNRLSKTEKPADPKPIKGKEGADLFKETAEKTRTVQEEFSTSVENKSFIKVPNKKLNEDVSHKKKLVFNNTTNDTNKTFKNTPLTKQITEEKKESTLKEINQPTSSKDDDWKIKEEIKDKSGNTTVIYKKTFSTSDKSKCSRVVEEAEVSTNKKEKCDGLSSTLSLVTESNVEEKGKGLNHLQEKGEKCKVAQSLNAETKVNLNNSNKLAEPEEVIDTYGKENALLKVKNLIETSLEIVPNGFSQVMDETKDGKKSSLFTKPDVSSLGTKSSDAKTEMIALVSSKMSNNCYEHQDTKPKTELTKPRVSSKINNNLEEQQTSNSGANLSKQKVLSKMTNSSKEQKEAKTENNLSVPMVLSKIPNDSEEHRAARNGTKEVKQVASINNNEEDQKIVDKPAVVYSVNPTTFIPKNKELDAIKLGSPSALRKLKSNQKVDSTGNYKISKVPTEIIILPNRQSILEQQESAKKIKTENYVITKVPTEKIVIESGKPSRHVSENQETSIQIQVSRPPPPKFKPPPPPMFKPPPPPPMI